MKTWRRSQRICRTRAVRWKNWWSLSRLLQGCSRRKRSRNVIDFQDMEQFALKILTEEKDGILAPSTAAREYQAQFEEAS